MRALRAKLTAKHLRKPDSYSCSMRKAPSSEEVQFAHRSIDNRIDSILAHMQRCSSSMSTGRGRRPPSPRA